MIRMWGRAVLCIDKGELSLGTLYTLGKASLKTIASQGGLHGSWEYSRAPELS